MNAEAIRENFKKVYGKNDKLIYVFKMSHGLKLQGEYAESINKKVIGIGISPETYVAIRLCDEDVFSVRYWNSAYLYKCKKDDLRFYNEKDRAKEIFNALAYIVGDSKISGAEFFLYSDYYTDFFDESVSACVYGISMITNAKTNDLLKVILYNTADYKKNSQKLISLNSYSNRCEIIENGIVSAYTLPLKGYRIIIIRVVDKKEQELDFEKENKSLCEFAEMELKRYILAKNSLIIGNYNMFGKVVKASGEEYLKLLNCEKIKTVFDLSKDKSEICGVFENCGIYAVVRDDAVDDFIKTVGEEYESLEGKIPEFYVCKAAQTNYIFQPPFTPMI